MGDNRPSTAAMRPRSARPDTGVSAIGELPDQTFFPEHDEVDEEEEDFSEEEEGVFAFQRPVTAVAPGVLGGKDNEQQSAPTTGRGSNQVEPLPPPTLDPMAATAPTGNVDASGQVPSLPYDPRAPPPFTGRSNMNNSSFAYTMSDGTPTRRRSSIPTIVTSSRPGTAVSFLSRFNPRNRGHAPDDRSRTSFGTGTSQADTSIHSDLDSPGIEGPRKLSNRRMKSSTPLIDGTDDGYSEYDAKSMTTYATHSDGISTPGRSRGRATSRSSYMLSELDGSMTVPDGRTTRGDGLGGFAKTGSEEDSIGAMDPDMIEEDSPYPEVRASVSNIDDPDMPALTIRSWTLGMLFSIVACAVNTFLHFRTPAPFIPVLLIQIAAYPAGKFCAWWLPITTYKLPRFLGGTSWSLNPGPFNIKEHAIIVMMANVSIGPAYAMYATVVGELYYNKKFGTGFTILLVLATQLSGFGIAGIARRFVVWPASMIWPYNLVTATTLNTFHAEDDQNTGGMTRFRFFLITMAGAFAWYFLPGFLFTCLSYFSYMCWIFPKNRVVNQLFGVSTGLGMGVINFDWAQITWIGSPLAAPWWAEVNVTIGFLLFYWIIVPILYYTNVWNFAYLPISVIQAADRFGQSYDIFQVLTPDADLNVTAYHEYSPVYLSATFAMTFMLAFALSTAILVHTALHYGPRIWKAIRNVKVEEDDIHLKLMRQYPEVPDWWFAVLLLFTFVLGIIGLEVWNTGFPIWGYILGIIVPFLYFVPAAFLYAITTQNVSINLLAQLIPGYLFPGKPIPVMIFKVYGVQTIYEALRFVQDMKLGHYMKVPPRSTFIAQVSATSVACFVQVGVKTWLFKTVPTICQRNAPMLLTCQSQKVFMTSSVIWGLIGPKRIFSHGPYNFQLYTLLIGAFLPVPLWFWVRRHPRSIFRNLNIAVVLNGPLGIPPANGANYSMWALTGFVFQYLIRRRNFAWWAKYNYVLSASLDGGTLLSAVIQFLILGLTGAKLDWWGNRVYKQTADWNGEGAAFYTAPADGFGPKTWN